MKYRKKPVVVNAEQFTGVEIPGVYSNGFAGWWVMTIHLDKIEVVPGDWIIQEPDGIHYYPVKDYIFKNTYEVIDEQAG